MSPSLAETFRIDGYVQLAGFHPRARVEPIRRQVQAELERRGLRARGKRSRNPVDGMPAFQQIARLSTMIRIERLHAILVNPELLALVHTLAAGRVRPVADAQLLLSPPDQGTWRLRQLNWHVDAAAAPGRLPGIQAFFLIDDVAVHGGATLALAGSHRWGEAGPAANEALRRRLKAADDPGAELADAGVRLVEMCGRAGDVYLMDMRMLHTPSINATRHVRMMATTRHFIDPA